MQKKDTKVFLFGEYRGNTGTSNVNFRLLNMSEGKFSYRKFQNKLLKQFETIYHILASDITVFSCFDKHIKLWFRIVKMFEKKSIYLMHGCVSYENDLNRLGVDQKMIHLENWLLENVDVVLCVSERYMEWVKQRYPRLKNVHYLNSGVDYFVNELAESSIAEESKVWVVAAAGGDRPQKNNQTVCNAIASLNTKEKNSLMFNIYGRRYLETNIFSTCPNVNYKGMVPYEQFLKELHGANLFVINSTVESFGLSALDALKCGCSILIAENAGVCSILQVEETDIIHDVNDIEEIASKIRYLLDNPNYHRLCDSIDFEHYSWGNVAKRLYDICDALRRDQDYTMIR